MKKKDYINSLIVGEIIALFVLVVFLALRSEIPDQFNFLDSIIWFSPAFFPVLGITVVSSTALLKDRWIAVPQFGKFCFVGLSNFSIDFGILNFLIFYSGYDSGIYFAVFKGVSFLLAQGNSFTWNRLWTFDENETNSVMKQFLRFFAVVLIGLFINVSVASLIVDNFGEGFSVSSAVWANIAALISLIFTIIWNFIGMRIFVFNIPDRPGD